MKTIQDMAREAGISSAVGKYIALEVELEAFAALVREDELDVCAKVMLSIANVDAGNPYKQALRMGAEAIRARSNK